MWVGLLIFYVANVENVANVFCWIFKQSLLDFPSFSFTQKPHLCIEFQSAMKSNQLINIIQNYGICRNDSCREQLGRKAGFYAAQQSGIYAVLPRCSRSDAGGVSERYLRDAQGRHGEELHLSRGHESAGVLRAARESIEGERQMVHLLPRLANRCSQLMTL